MPSKGNRAASRQANLRRKKRRGKGAAQSFEVGPTESKRALVDVENSETPASPNPATGVLEPTSARPSRPSRRYETETVPRYEYLGGELKRIGFTTSIIVGLLVALSFVLGG